MAKKSFFKNCLLFLLTLLFVVCTCAFFVACSSDDETTEEEEAPVTYSYTEEDTENISNGNFSYGTVGKTESDFPLTSATGWSRTTDNSAATSGVTSGVINVEKWDAVFDKFYSNNTFSKVCQNKFPEEYKKDGNDIPAETSKASIKSKFAPTKHSNEADNYMFMLNNYSTTYLGTAQKVTSSSTVSVKKGETYKISVFVRAIILDAFNDGDGANIRITPTVDGTTLADFQINNITSNDWKEYTVYFVADGDYDCSFKITLGLGYGNGQQENMSDYVQGTVFFDDVTVTKVTENIPSETTATVSFGSDPITVNGSEKFEFKFSTKFDVSEYFKADNKVALTGSAVTADYTKSNLTDKNGNKITSKTITGEVTGYSYNPETKMGTVTLEKENPASYTLTVKDNNGDPFEIETIDEENYEKYTLLSFKIKNGLNKLGSTDITVNVIESYHDDILNKDYEETRKAVATFSDVSDDFVDCYILVNNNFKAQTRNFYLEIVIGPSDPATVNYLSEFASGTVVITDIDVASARYISSEKYDDKEEDANYKLANYKLYTFYSGKASGTTALYAGYEADFSEHDHSTTYSLTPANGTTGKIANGPTAIKGYNGITTDSAYVNKDSTNYTINDRLSFTDEKSYAGLINTKYIANYPTALAGALKGLYDNENNIQPLVIYNVNDDHYGFIGAQQTVSASEFAKVTVKLKVVGDKAKAYIYLVDTSDDTKKVLTFADFTVNTEAGIKNAAIKDTSFTAEQHKYELVITKNSPISADGWVEVNFYLATGADAKNFRVEIWNGGRDGADATKSQGYVIVNSIDVSTSSAFSEPTTWQAAFDEESSPLFNQDVSEIIAYTRALTDTEKQFNEEYTDKAVSYKPNYVWAKGETIIYGVLNTINPVETNPYDSIEEEEDESGCAAESDPSTFWLSFSSIVLAAVLVIAIIALFVKKFRAKRKATKSNVNAQYKVKSRAESQKAIKQAKQQRAEKAAKTEISEDAEPENTAEETAENTEGTETEENMETNGEDTEQTDYVYGDVQDFGDMTLEMPEEKTEEIKPEEPEKENKDE